MLAETRSLTQLFQLDVRYVIPLYQRPYVWTKDRQWQPLWDDISIVAEHVFVDGASSRSPSHFLGAIVIQQQENPPGTPQQFLVIDGQQRLTTLQLLMGAVASFAKQQGYDDKAKLFSLLIYNNELLAKGVDIFKVWPTNSNRGAFQLALDPNGSPEDAPNDPDNEIQEAFFFFREKVAEWVLEEGDPGQRLEALRVTASDLLKLVAIRLEDGDNPQVIFETLNARGTPLIALDLLKNSVFLRAAEESADTDHLYVDHWAKELDLEHWRQERRQGRLFSKNGDLFLTHWLVIETGRPIPATELFATFQESVLSSASCPSMDDLIPQLCHDAQILRSFDDAPEGTPERRFFDRLDLLDTTTMIPVALLVGRDPDIDSEVRERVFLTIEDFLMRRMICGLTTKNYNRLAAELIKAIKTSDKTPDVAAHEFLASQYAPANRWPDDEEIFDAIRSKQLYGYRAQPRLVEVLWEIEKRLRTLSNKTEQDLVRPPDLTLEHIIPQSWQEHWPLDETKEDPVAWREEHLHKLGNLTLITGPLNSSLSNAPWTGPDGTPGKRDHLVSHSLLRLNSALATDYPDPFTEADVDQRGAGLAQHFVAIWPGPKSSETPTQ